MRTPHYTIFIRDKDDVIEWAQNAKHGGRLLYFIGDLLAARTETRGSEEQPTAAAIAADGVAGILWHLHQEGLVELAQQKLDENIRAYFAYRNHADATNKVGE